MSDKEFKELVKIAAEKLKDESVLLLLNADEGYQQISENEGNAEAAFNTALTLKKIFTKKPPILWENAR